jgi:cell division protein ZapA
MFDHQVRQVSQDMGQLGDTRLFLMGALLLADELADARSRLGALQAEVGRLQTDRGRLETRAVAALESAAKRIEKLAAEEA